jgi:HEAT repeat protein
MSDDRELSREEKLELLQGIEASQDVFTDFTGTILDFLDDPDAEVRAQAIRCLWDYTDADLIDTLMDRAKKDPAQEVRSAALIGLGRFIYEGDMADYENADLWGDLMADELPQEDFERTRQFLLDVAHDPQASLDSHRFAVEALSFLTDDEVTELIDQAYNHPNLKMKVSAIFAMGRQGVRRWEKTLLREMDSPVPELRYEAVRAAGESFLETASPKLLEIVRTVPDNDLKIAAILSLGRTGGDDAFEFLDDLTSSRDQELRQAAAVALDDWFTYYGQGEWEFDEDEWEEGDEEWEEEDN